MKWEQIQDLDDHTKWLRTDCYFGENRTLPMWVADMDFCCPAEVTEALTKRVAHGIFGYSFITPDYLQAVAGWMKRRHGWNIEQNWIVTCPGVVPALHMLVQALSAKTGKVLVQRPVYYPFFSAIEQNGKLLVSNSLQDTGDSYLMDFDDLRQKAGDPQTNLIILCNPHNPVGRVWAKEELLEFGRICRKNGLIVIADEIHGDLIMPGSTFTPFASLEDFGNFTITCTAPSKTFNLAGLQASNIIIENKDLREAFQGILKKNGLSRINLLGMTAGQAAYNHGGAWLERLITYLDGQLDYLEKFFREELPSIKMYRPQGTYLVWLDFRLVENDHLVLRRKFLAEAKLFLDDGFIFGLEGRGFQRLNIACPPSILREAMARIKKTFQTV